MRRPAGGHLCDLLALGPDGASKPDSNPNPNPNPNPNLRPSPNSYPDPNQVLPLNYVQSVLLFKRNFYNVIARRTRKADLLEKLIH